MKKDTFNNRTTKSCNVLLGGKIPWNFYIKLLPIIFIFWIFNFNVAIIIIFFLF